MEGPTNWFAGVDIVGTPLARLDKNRRDRDTPEVFNGYCGRGSGSVQFRSFTCNFDL